MGMQGDLAELKRKIGKVVGRADLYRDQKGATTSAGTFTASAWRTRTLNTESRGKHPFSSLSSNQVTIHEAGRYLIMARFPKYNVNHTRCRLYDVTNSATRIIGSTEFNNTEFQQIDNQCWGVFETGGGTAYELQHVCDSTKATDGLGRGEVDPGSGGMNTVYAQVIFIKLE